MRFERKFMAGREQIGFARAWLNHVCLPDPLYPFGVVSSIYFDTPRLASYQEKADGDFSKTKVRLRWYDAPKTEKEDETAAFLEIKMKDGNKSHKERKKLRLSRKWLNQVDLTDKDLGDIASENLPQLGFKSFDRWFPSLVVTYDRERFICPTTGARVSLDTQIGSDRSNREIFSSGASQGHLESVVVEIKDEEIKDVSWLKEMYHSGFRLQSFSKYALCMQKFIYGVA